MDYSLLIFYLFTIHEILSIVKKANATRNSLSLFWFEAAVFDLQLHFICRLEIRLSESQ